MFGILKVFGLTDPLKIAKYLGIAAVVIVCFLFYKNISSKLEQLEEANKTIQVQAQAITSLNEEILKLKESNEITLKYIKDLENKKQEVQKVIEKQTKYVTREIEVIKVDPGLNDSEKEIKRSEIYILSLNDTYCQLNLNPCD